MWLCGRATTNGFHPVGEQDVAVVEHPLMAFIQWGSKMWLCGRASTNGFHPVGEQDVALW